MTSFAHFSHIIRFDLDGSRLPRSSTTELPDPTVHTVVHQTSPLHPSLDIRSHPAQPIRNEGKGTEEPLGTPRAGHVICYGHCRVFR